MDTGVISAAFGALTQERRFEIIANNLANAATAGFKRDRLTFADLLHPPSPRTSGKPQAEPAVSASGLMPVGFGPNWDASRVRVTSLWPDLMQGGLEETGNPLDVAIEGSGFFRLQTPQGTRYTRRGSFALAKDGTLVSQDGYPVLGAGNQKITISGQGTINIGRDGTVSAGGQQAGRLELAQFPEGAPLEKAGDSLFAANGDPGPPTQSYLVRQGSLELSNVNTVEEMVSMVDALRQYETYQKMLQAYGQMDSKSIEVAEVR